MTAIDSKFINKACLISYEDQEWQGIFFDWNTINDDSKEFLEDELGDEMFDNENLVPIGIFSFEDDEIDLSNIDSYIENGHLAEIYLMLDSEKGTLHESGRADTSIDIESLNIRLK